MPGLKKLDKLVIALSCIGIVLSFYMVFRPADDTVLVVYSDNEKLEFPMDDNEFVIKNSHGSMRIIIRDGRVQAAESTCEDKWCTDKGRIGRVGDSIVCLPAHIFLTIRQENKDKDHEFDTITR
jgi:hypothetical protein